VVIFTSCTAVKLENPFGHSENEPTLRCSYSPTWGEYRDLVLSLIALDEHHDHGAADRSPNANADKGLSDDWIETSERAKDDCHRNRAKTSLAPGTPQILSLLRTSWPVAKFRVKGIRKSSLDKATSDEQRKSDSCSKDETRDSEHYEK
jgi:hypothetical protein